MQDKPVIILAGGYGTRLKSFLNGMPKPMVDVNGSPFLEYILKNLIQNGFRNFIFALNYKSEVVIDYLNFHRSGFLANCKVEYYVEKKPLGTGGAISHILSLASIKDEFYRLNEIKHLEANVIALVNVLNSSRYGKVEINSDDVITKFIEKGEDLGEGLINAGFYKFNKNLFENWNKICYSLESDFFPLLLNQKKLRGYVLNTDFIDIGVPKDYLQFCELSKNL